MTLVPDLLALCILLLLLLLLRTRHAAPGMQVWFVGLLLLLGASIARILQVVPGPWRYISQAAGLDCYALAGAVFVYAALHQTMAPRRLAPALLLTSLPRLGALTLFGLDVQSLTPFYVAALLGFGASVASCIALRCERRTQLIASYAALWTVFCFAVSRHSLSFAAYWLLCCLFLQAAWYFAQTLPVHSIGRLTIVSGFALWALLFLAHSTLETHPRYSSLTDGLWNLQKFQIAVGLLILMLEAQVERTKELALHDPLTALPNRRLLDDRLNQAMLQAARTRTRVGFLMLDLNNFKDINDHFGHAVGDQVLCEVAENLRRCVRSSDTIARLGGDEFALVVSGFTTAQPLTSELLRTVQQPIQVNGAPFTVSGALGLAIFPDDTRDATRLRQLADERMYLHKRESETRAHPTPVRSVPLPLFVETERSSS